MKPSALAEGFLFKAWFLFVEMAQSMMGKN